MKITTFHISNRLGIAGSGRLLISVKVLTLVDFVATITITQNRVGKCNVSNRRYDTKYQICEHLFIIKTQHTEQHLTNK